MRRAALERGTPRRLSKPSGMAGGMADITKIKVQQARRAAYARGDAMLAEIFNQWLMCHGKS